MTPRTTARELRCDLNAQEVADRADQLGRELRQRSDTEKDKADSNAAFSADLKRLTSVIATLGEEVRTRSTIRPVECRSGPDYNAAVMETFRLDTGEIVARRPLTIDEAQPELAGLATDLERELRDRGIEARVDIPNTQADRASASEVDDASGGLQSERPTSGEDA